MNGPRAYANNGRAARWSRAAVFFLFDVYGSAPEGDAYRSAMAVGVRWGLLSLGLMHLTGAIGTLLS